MDEQNNKTGLILLIILITGFWIWSNYKEIGRLEDENVYLEDELSSCQTSLSDYQTALEEANNNIEEANSIIEEAQSYTWSSYEEMGEALDNLYIVDTVPEP